MSTVRDTAQARSAEVQILDGGQAVRIRWRDGHVQRFHALWLRDNALDPQTRATGNGQRLITIRDLPARVHIHSARCRGDTLELTFAPEGKLVVFPFSWLRAHGYDRALERQRGRLPATVTTWDSGLDPHTLSEDYATIRSSPGARARWLGWLQRFGFAHLRNGPVESGALLDVVALFGHVRETNYGRWFEVREQSQPSNLAFTGLGLQAHTDNPYRDPVPGLQLLYCLRNDAEGGDSFVVDGFHAARRLQEDDPSAFDLLSKYCARFAYDGTADVQLRARRPMLELSADGELLAVRFNNRAMAPLTDVPYTDLTAYYAAYRRLCEVVDCPTMTVSFSLAPGECFVVDNTRVLHGRTAFTGGGGRWLQGCYADKDGLASTLAVLETQCTQGQSSGN